MTTKGRLHDVVHRHRLAVDLAFALVLLFSIVMATKQHGAQWTIGPQTPPVLALEALVFGALLVRRKRPVIALGVIVVASTVVMLLIKGRSPIVVVAVVAVFSVSVRNDRWTALAAGLGAGVCLMFGGALRSGDWFSPDSVSTLAWTFFAAALGQAIRSQKAYVTAVEERARRAEQTREEEAARRVIEERLRIARELHDVVAHHIAVIQVQSGVVDHLLTERPDAAREALGHVRRASKTVLEELSGMLDVLRQPDDPLTPTDPAPGLARLTTLIDQFAVSGLTVDWRIIGTPQTLPAAVDLVAYRLIQESLTNAHKHGTGPAEMVLRFLPAALVIEVVNRIAVPVGALPSGTGGSGSASSSDVGTGHLSGTAQPVGTGQRTGPHPGHGLAGMQERANAVGGSVSASARDGATWRVVARVPLSTESEGEPPASGPSCRRGPAS
jgi:signal transduction histidine kinase